MLNLFFLSLVIVFIVDISGVMDTIKKFIHKRYVKVGDYHNLDLRPFSCSLCSVWWIGLIYLIFTNKFTIPYIAFVALLSMLSSNMADLERFIMDAFTYIINLLYKIIEK